MMNTKAFDKKKFISQNTIWLILVVMVILVSILRPAFLSMANLKGLMEGESVKGVLAFGVMWAILAKGIDLAPGAVAALVSVVVASLIQPADLATRILGTAGLHVPSFVAILIGIAIGAIIGAVFGAIIAYTGIPPFIATLGSQLICRALSKMYSTAPVSNLPDDYRWIAKGKMFGFIPMIIVFFVIMFIISAFLLTQTRFGKNIFAIGGNIQAAKVAGINVEKNLILVYMWCSICAAIGGILLAARTGSSDPSTTGLNYELDAIAAATVGGTSHTGGVCRVSGVLCGILIMGVINNGLVLLGVDDNMTNIVKGLIIIVSVSIDMRKNSRKV